MSGDQKKTPTNTPTPSSGSGSDSALQAMIKKRPPQQGQEAQQPQGKAHKKSAP